MRHIYAHKKALVLYYRSLHRNEGVPTGHQQDPLPYHKNTRTLWESETTGSPFDTLDTPTASLDREISEWKEGRGFESHLLSNAECIEDEIDRNTVNSSIPILYVRYMSHDSHMITG